MLLPQDELVGLPGAQRILGHAPTPPALSWAPPHCSELLLPNLHSPLAPFHLPRTCLCMALWPEMARTQAHPRDLESRGGEGHT